jgi:hypothetical protein
MVGSQRRTVLSLEPEAMRSPVGETATECTAACRVHRVTRALMRSRIRGVAVCCGVMGGAGFALWPAKRKARSCGLKFHTITQESVLPETSCFMFGLKATLVTESLCPRNERSRAGSWSLVAMVSRCWRERAGSGSLLDVSAEEESV